MADLIFPPPPLTIGQEYDGPNGVTYAWDGEAWVAASGMTALWSDAPSSGGTAGLLTPRVPGRSLALDASTALHFGDPTKQCPCVEAEEDDLQLEVSGDCRVICAGATVATFDGAGLSVPGRLDAPAGGALTGRYPDPLLRPGVTLYCAVPIGATPHVSADIAGVESLVEEWTVPEQAGRPVCTWVAVALTVQNIQGGIQQQSDTVLSLRRGGTAGQTTGTLVQELPPLVVAVPQNAIVAATESLVALVTPTATGPVRWSVTARNPNTKFTVQTRRVTGTALGFA